MRFLKFLLISFGKNYILSTSIIFFDKTCIFYGIRPIPANFMERKGTFYDMSTLRSGSNRRFLQPMRCSCAKACRISAIFRPAGETGKRPQSDPLDLYHRGNRIRRAVPAGISCYPFFFADPPAFGRGVRALSVLSVNAKPFPVRRRLFCKIKRGRIASPSQTFTETKKEPVTHSAVLSGDCVETPAPYPQHYMRACHKEKFSSRITIPHFPAKSKPFCRLIFPAPPGNSYNQHRASPQTDGRQKRKSRAC